MEMFLSPDVDRILRAALAEDIGSGDVTSRATVAPERNIAGRYIAKENGVLCGLGIVARVFALLDASIAFTALAADGDRVRKGDVIATVSGDARAILAGERVGLNLLQHMSGVATQTARAVAAVVGTKAKIVDTRKATPGLRILDKYAVRAGGGDVVEDADERLDDLVLTGGLVAGDGLLGAAHVVGVLLALVVQLRVGAGQLVLDARDALEGLGEVGVLDLLLEGTHVVGRTLGRGLGSVIRAGCGLVVLGRLAGRG